MSHDENGRHQNSQANLRPRTELTPEMRERCQPGFRKGTSGNPGGQSAALREVKRLCKELCPQAVERLWAIANQDKDLKAANEAIKVILVRGLGREQDHEKLEQLTTAAETNAVSIDLKTLTDDQLARIEQIVNETAS